MSTSSSRKASGVTSTSDKPSIVELKNGKVILKQKPLSFDKLSETMQGIVKFREMLEEHMANRSNPFTRIPDDHLPLIATLGHESDKTLPALTKHIFTQIMPAQDEEQDDSYNYSTLMPLSCIESAVKSVLVRNNYGLDSLVGGGRHPAVVCVWRWEVKEEYRDWLPKSVREKVDTRQAERTQAKKELGAIFENLSQEEQDAIMNPKGTGKASATENKPRLQKLVGSVDTEGKASTKPRKKAVGSKEQDDNMLLHGTSAVDMPKKAIDPEKAAKDKARQEKKAAKVEKEKKQKEAHDRSRSMMANFFSKAKTLPPGPSQPTPDQSEFERAFKPFVVRKDAELSPINWFRERKRRPRNTLVDGAKEVIDLVVEGDDDTDISMQGPSILQDCQEMTPEDRLQSILDALQSSTVQRRSSHHQSHLKSYTPLAVRDIMSQLSEAEIAGDVSLVRKLLSKLRNRNLIPAKVLIFSEDARPGYFGTWTRSSRIVGPRTPFAKDMLTLHYGYDSGEEWEEENAGDADDVNQDEDEEDDGDSSDSDLDSWLVDDDEEPMISLDVPNLSPLPDVSPAPPKRKPEGEPKKLAKKRKVVVPLAPFSRGPCWEPTIGHCEIEMFRPYRIQLFNDTPFPIDPFTFMSSCVEDHKKSTIKPTSDLTVIADVTNGPDLKAQLPPPTAPMKRTASAPKTTFPDVLLPTLLTKINNLQAASITFLIEAVYQDLRIHKVKKNTLEAKVREVSEKCKDKKVWIVKPSIAASHGLNPV